MSVEVIVVVENELKDEEGSCEDEEDVLVLNRDYHHDWHNDFLCEGEVHDVFVFEVFDAVVVGVGHHKGQNVQINDTKGNDGRTDGSLIYQSDEQYKTSFLYHQEQHAEQKLGYLDQNFFAEVFPAVAFLLGIFPILSLVREATFVVRFAGH